PFAAKNPAAPPAAACNPATGVTNLYKAPPLPPPRRVVLCRNRALRLQPHHCNPPRHVAARIHGTVSLISYRDSHGDFLLNRWAAPFAPAKTGGHARCYGPSFLLIRR